MNVTTLPNRKCVCFYYSGQGVSLIDFFLRFINLVITLYFLLLTFNFLFVYLNLRYAIVNPLAFIHLLFMATIISTWGVILRLLALNVRPTTHSLGGHPRCIHALVCVCVCTISITMTQCSIYIHWNIGIVCMCKCLWARDYYLGQSKFLIGVFLCLRFIMRRNMISTFNLLISLLSNMRELKLY